MPFSILAEPGTGVVIGTGNGDLTLEDAKVGAETLWANPEWKGKPMIWDLRSATLKIRAPEVRQLAEYILGRQTQPPPRVAVVTGRDADYGLARMFEVFREHPATDVRIFREFDEALVWTRTAGARSTSARDTHS